MTLEWICNINASEGGISFDDFGLVAAKEVRAYHQSMPEYAATPLRALPDLAASLKLKALYVKDEQPRFGLNAFKGLGGSYAVHKALEAHPENPNPVFATATDGNHGRGVAWAARRAGCQAHIYMPEGTVAERLNNILSLGAHAQILSMPYDDCARYAASMAKENGWVLVQDTAWEGYEAIPKDIMRGYTTMGDEITEQLAGERPTHIFLQAGVGSMAASMAAFFADAFRDNRPKFVIVEPTTADCFYQTALHDDGRLHTATGPLDSMMAGLCCGEVNPLAWDILSRCGDAFVLISDDCAARAMFAYAHPHGEDPRVISGESGASTLGALLAMLENDDAAPLREALSLNEDASVLLISTEGATDRANYLRITGVDPDAE